MFPTIVDEAQQNSIQGRGVGGLYSGIPLLLSMVTGSSLLPPWWSPARDQALRSFWKKGDHLAGAMYNMIAKMTAIPFSAVPKDYTDTKLAEEAERETERLLDGAEFGEGWNTFYSKILEDMLGTDNGWFAEVIGPGNPIGPITGQPITVAHLDSARCQRTGDPDFPVLYYSATGKPYKLHFTRVMFNSQMPSAIEEMNGVGFCAVSRAVMTAQNLIDIAVYKMEKLGSRPHRELLITQGGLDPEDVRSAFAMAGEMNDNQGFSRYSKIVVTGHQAIPNADIKQISFTNLPDGFDEKTAVTLGMAVVAMAFGVDARDLFPGLEAGATRADALLSHLKQRGKGPGQIISDVEAQHNRKFLPVTMRMVFDFQDDAEDQQVAEIKHLRAQRRERDVGTGTIDTRVAREQMVADGDLTRKQFETLELQSGRLLDGTPVIALFHSSEARYKTLLTLEDVENPLDTSVNDATYILMKADEAIMKVNEKLLNATSADQRVIFQRSAAALEELKNLYIEPKPVGAEPGDNSQKPRLYPTRRENLLTPNPKVELSTRVDTLPGKDDKELSSDPITRLRNLQTNINALITQANQIPSINLVVPEDNSDKETPLESSTIRDITPIDRLRNLMANVNTLIAQTDQAPPINIVLPKEWSEPPVVNITPPEVIINFPKEKELPMEINTEPVVIDVPKPETPVINITYPDQKVLKRKNSRKAIRRDQRGEAYDTQAVEEYVYGEQK